MRWEYGEAVNGIGATTSPDLPPWIPRSLQAYGGELAYKSRLANMTSVVENYNWVGVVDTVILSLTVVGACLILGSTAWFEYSGRPSTTRMRIVQSLVVSDLVIGLVGLIGSALAFQDKLIEGTSSCDGLGVMLVAVLWTEHLWTLTLAISTFFILIYPLHAFTIWLEKFWAWLWAFVWTTAFGIAVLGYELYGYTPSGGICYYPSSSGLYGELIQFIPRGVVFLTIAALYGRLFVFLRRPDKIKVSFSNTNGTGSGNFIASASRGQSRFFRLPSFFGGRKSTPEGEAPSPEKVRDYAAAPDPLTPPGDGEVPPWEKVQLPAFQVDGQRFGGSGSTGQGSSTLWGGWRGVKGRRENSVVSGSKVDRSSFGSSPSSPTLSPKPGQSRVFGSMSSAADALNSKRERDGSRVLSPAIRLDPVLPSPPLFELNSESAPTPVSVALTARRRSGELSGSLTTLHAERLRRLSGQSPLETSSVGAEGRSNLTSEFASNSRRPSALSDASSQPASPASPSPASAPDSSTPLRPTLPAQQLASFRSYRMQGVDEETGSHEPEMDFMDMLNNHQPPVTEQDRFRPDTDGDIEIVEESMASYLNRKTALLMLWFPLGYVLLFSISLVRIIYDFAGHPPVILRALSRWFIFAQGILDALIYGYVEWHTKRVVRRRVKRGHFSTHSQQGTNNSFTNMASALRTFGNGSRRPTSPRNNVVRSQHSPVQSFTGPRQTQTVSFDPIEEERNIMQQLSEGYSRKSSLPNSSLTAPISIDGRDESSGHGSESGKSAP